jgi:site-specific DNA recombinase
MNRQQNQGIPDPSSLAYAAIYARVSTEDQGKGFSIPTQIEACRKLAAREGYTVPESHILVDEGISGTTMDRPDLRKLRDLVTSKAIAAAIVYDPDRLSRNLGHQLLLAEEFERASVKLLIVSHPLEQGPEGWLFFQMRGALAEYERAKIQERTQRGRMGRAKAGHVWGGEVKLGYRAIREPHKASWDIDEDEAALVRRIFQMALEGMSQWAIAVHLTREHIPTRRDRTRGSPKRRGVGVWTPSTIHRILTYEGYTGRWFYGKYKRTSRTRRVLRDRAEWIEVAIPAIIDDATFQAVQRQLATNRATSRRNRKYDYLLTGGRLRCGQCGRAMSGRTSRSKFRYYRCASWSNGAEPSGRCYGEPRVDEIDSHVWAAVVRLLEQPELIAQEVQRQHDTADDQRAEVQQELTLIEAGLTKCEREQQKWEQAYVDDAIDLADFKAKKAEVEARRQSLLRQRAEADAKLESIGQAVEQVEALIDYCRRAGEMLQTFEYAEKRQALETLSIRATWTPGQPLAIEGTIPMGDIVLMPSKWAHLPSVRHTWSI